MKKLALLILIAVFLPGFTACECKDKIVEVPVVVKTDIKMPGKPDLASSKLNNSSTEDEVVKAAIKDVNTLEEYAKELERLLK